ncbi:hypothetical protein EAF00_011441 [Botryotinia globosa]|nr:hypothetical protein EAF00_011441 [Botryotinia globosa]
MISTQNSWADGPWELLGTPGNTQDTKKHAAIHSTNEMAHLHDCEIRCINCIYLQGPHVKAKEDVKDFLFFVKAWCSFVKHHHDVEEELVFPQFESFTEKPGCMSANVAQHAMFEPGLHELADCSQKTSHSEFSAITVRSLIDGFADALRNHIKSEISALLAL